MCRHQGWLGEPVDLARLLAAPPHSLERQSWEPRQMRHGTINADGWGVGWYEPDRPEPGRYRTTRPIWADPHLHELAPFLRSGCVVAAVRDATQPTPSEDTGVAPFRADRWLFSHNGLIEGFRDGVGTELRRMLSPSRESGLLGSSDSEVLFALVLDRLDAGASPGDAVEAALAVVTELTGGRFNVMLADGERLVATALGDTLVVRDDREGSVGGALPLDAPPRGVHVASEPFDDDPRWEVVPDGSLVEVSSAGVETRSLTLPEAAA